jgi:O-antigen/teichoic acid export membrane protein
MFPSFIANYSTGITDANYQDKYLPYLFVILNVLMYARRTSSQILNFAGHFKQTQWRSVLESAINLVVSISLIPFLGIYGVLIGTIVAMLYRTNDIIIYVNTKILERSPWPTYRRWFQNTVIMVALILTINKILPQINGWISWALNACWVAALCIISFVLVDSLCDKTSFKTACEYIKSTLKKHT